MTRQGEAGIGGDRPATDVMLVALGNDSCGVGMPSFLTCGAQILRWRSRPTSSPTSPWNLSSSFEYDELFQVSRSPFFETFGRTVPKRLI